MKPGSGCNVLEGLPRWPALDKATCDLFKAVAVGDEGGAARAIGEGASLEAIEPYRAEGQDVMGGYSPLQLACSSWPGRAVSLEVVALLLDAGANPNGNTSQAGLPLRRLSHCLPSNAVEAAELLFQSGAIADVGMVADALLAERHWVRPFVSSQSLPLAAAIWAMLPDEERQQLDPNLPTQLVGIGGAGADGTGVSRAKWVLDRLAGVPLDTSPAGLERTAAKSRVGRPH